MTTTVLVRPNVAPEVLCNYDIVMNPLDTLGRRWRMAAWPKRGGTIAFFNSLSEMRQWERQVIDMRRMEQGEPTLTDILHSHRLRMALTGP